MSMSMELGSITNYSFLSIQLTLTSHSSVREPGGVCLGETASIYRSLTYSLTHSLTRTFENEMLYTQAIDFKQQWYLLHSM